MAEIKIINGRLTVCRNRNSETLLVQFKFSIFSRSSSRDFSFSGLVIYCNSMKQILRAYFVEFAVSFLLYWVSRKFWIGN